MVDFRAIIENLVDMGFYSVILPFLLVYVVVYGILVKSKIFTGGDSDSNQVKNINAIIAFVFALFVIASLQTVMYIQSLILNIVLIIIFILVLLILLAFIFGEDYHKLFRDTDGNVKGWVSWTIGIVVFLVALGILFQIIGFWGIILEFFDDTISDTEWGTPLILILIVGIIIWVTKSDSSSSSKKEDK